MFCVLNMGEAKGQAVNLFISIVGQNMALSRTLS